MNIDPASVHRLKNKLAVILGFCELLLSEMATDNPHRADVEQILQAGKSALVELPRLAGHDIADALDPAEAGDGR
jgi:signal transduction histidine kinase